MSRARFVEQNLMLVATLGVTQSAIAVNLVTL